MGRAIARFWWTIVVLVAGSSAAAQDRIVLRDLTIVGEGRIASLDADGLVLSQPGEGGERVITWDQVEAVQLADAAQQEQADRLLSEIGLPLYRLHVRLEIGDEQGLLQPAEKLFETFRERRSPSSLVVLQSLVWGRIAQGERERAVEPWLLAYETLRSRGARLSELPGERRPQLEAATALLAELAPIWFDAEAAKEALPRVEAVAAAMAEPVPHGATLYAASLALAAGDIEKAQSYLATEMPSDSAAAELRTILLAQGDVLNKQPAAAIARLSAFPTEPPMQTEGRFRPDYRPLALYWLGRARLASEKPADREEGLLALMQVPALYARQSPEIAAAALHEVGQAYASEPRIAARLKAEMRDQFPSTWHGRQAAKSP
jgi:hypothetical protein